MNAFNLYLLTIPYSNFSWFETGSKENRNAQYIPLSAHLIHTWHTVRLSSRGPPGDRGAGCTPCILYPVHPRYTPYCSCTPALCTVNLDENNSFNLCFNIS